MDFSRLPVTNFSRTTLTNGVPGYPATWSFIVIISLSYLFTPRFFNAPHPTTFIRTFPRRSIAVSPRNFSCSLVDSRQLLFTIRRSAIEPRPMEKFEEILENSALRNFQRCDILTKEGL